MNEQDFGEGIGALAGAFGAMFFAFILVMIVVAIVPYWKITQRLGWDPWWSLLIFVPLGALVWSYYVAFSEWPIERGRRNGDGSTSPPHSPQYPPS